MVRLCGYSCFTLSHKGDCIELHHKKVDDGTAVA